MSVYGRDHRLHQPTLILLLHPNQLIIVSFAQIKMIQLIYKIYAFIWHRQLGDALALCAFNSKANLVTTKLCAAASYDPSLRTACFIMMSQHGSFHLAKYIYTWMSCAPFSRYKHSTTFQYKHVTLPTKQH